MQLSCLIMAKCLINLTHATFAGSADIEVKNKPSSSICRLCPGESRHPFPSVILHVICCALLASFVRSLSALESHLHFCLQFHLCWYTVQHKSMS